VLKLQRAGQEWKACCPFHNERSPSFTIYAGGERFFCFGCQAQGDVFDFLQLLHGVGFREAVAMLDGGAVPRITVQHQAVRRETASTHLHRVARIFSDAGLIEGSVADRYLVRRGLAVNGARHLRHSILPFAGGQHDALVAGIFGSDDKLCGVHRIFLTSIGEKKSFDGGSKFSLGTVAGGAVPLDPPQAELVVCAGIEEGLALRMMLSVPAWAVTGDSMLARVHLPAMVRSVVVAHDADESGKLAAAKAAERFSLEGRSVRLLAPAPPHKDFNAELLASERNAA
jgi:DNA primase